MLEPQKPAPETLPRNASQKRVAETHPDRPSCRPIFQQLFHTHLISFPATRYKIRHIPCVKSETDYFEAPFRVSRWKPGTGSRAEAVALGGALDIAEASRTGHR
jgi:hypothetical protein